MPKIFTVESDCVALINSYPIYLAPSTKVISSGEGPKYTFLPFLSTSGITWWAKAKALMYYFATSFKLDNFNYCFPYESLIISVESKGVSPAPV